METTLNEAADLADWLSNHDTGISSEAIAGAAFGHYPPKTWGHSCYPSDGGDLGRCVGLLRRCPWARRGLAFLATKNAVWARIESAWDELSELLAMDEADRAGRAVMPKGWESRTYPRLRQLIYQRSDIGGMWEAFVDTQGRWDHRKVVPVSAERGDCEGYGTEQPVADRD